jgi:acyl carrier protein
MGEIMNTEEIQTTVISVLNDITQDWEMDNEQEISGDTGLIGDLAFESIDIVQLAVSLERKFGQEGLPFEQLFMRDGDYVEELKVSEVVNFLSKNIA